MAASQGLVQPHLPVPTHHRQQQTFTSFPLLRIHVTIKRKNANFHGQSEFDVFASPVVLTDGTSLRYDGYTTFVEDGTKFTYSLVGGASYLATKKDGANTETVQCLPSGALSYDSVLPALNDAVPIRSALIGDISVACASSNLFKSLYHDAIFAVCASGSSEFTATGLDLTLDVEYLQNPVNI
ncbi:hypothetical protein PHYSODRAFT_336697 [Phytophthora sojae]|uniref:Uncharacterized protein n=1 Tax=Phytophthora sojae (strain P6497) TaxID=1094619 RepID=G4ZVL5_PHYSP|nr:hypothetical protein PHYSODRAFT_336697 [Phytophthora sojae]EGZ12254.1 hypothetical protein PHYSODRAFT_336697 [Phytophthora sojae]|eukprot:XP_009532587.1 hypothetical protein PHYSODRAFT_336697 [Phytophthora sojae]